MVIIITKRIVISKIIKIVIFLMTYNKSPKKIPILKEYIKI
jgi:hypothetical protein